MALLPRRSDLQRGYDEVAAAYAQQAATELDDNTAETTLLDTFAAAIAGSGRCLDLGCGPGHVTHYLHQRGVDIEGLDISRAMVRQAASAYPKIRFKQGDVWKLKYDDHAFAAVFAKHLLSDIPASKLEDLFLNIRRIIEPGGALLVAFTTGVGSEQRPNWLGKDVEHTFYYHRTIDVVVQLRQAGFQEVSVYRRPPYLEKHEQRPESWILAESLKGIPPARKRLGV